MSMCEWFLMHVTIVVAYAIGSQAIRHVVVGPSGMSKHVRAWDMCRVLALHFVRAFGSRYSNCWSSAIGMQHTLNRWGLVGWPFLMSCSRAASKPAKSIHLLAIVYVIAK